MDQRQSLAERPLCWKPSFSETLCSGREKCSAFTQVRQRDRRETRSALRRGGLPKKANFKGNLNLLAKKIFLFGRHESHTRRGWKGERALDVPLALQVFHTNLHNQEMKDSVHCVGKGAQFSRWWNPACAVLFRARLCDALSWKPGSRSPPDSQRRRRQLGRRGHTPTDLCNTLPM